MRFVPAARVAMMPDPSESPSLLSAVGDLLKRQVLGVQEYALLAAQAVLNVFTPPVYWTDALEQMDAIGVGSLLIVIVAFLSIGGVLVLQTASEFQRFGQTATTGDAVSLALVRELGPAIAALLVAGRNASGIASELGSMVVTFIISTIACHKGLKVTGGTQGVGRATTSAVVVSSVWMLIIDLFLAKILLYIFQK
jgi:ABC-type transporter Mla maintaining outer membrane lipid asymmetry permease subunit MlaE